LRFSRKRQDGSAPNFFQDLTCLLQPALNSNAPGLQVSIKKGLHQKQYGPNLTNWIPKLF